MTRDRYMLKMLLPVRNQKKDNCSFLSVIKPSAFESIYSACISSDSNRASNERKIRIRNSLTSKYYLRAKVVQSNKCFLKLSNKYFFLAFKITFHAKYTILITLSALM